MAFRNLGITLRRSIPTPSRYPYVAQNLPVALRRKSIWYGGHGFIQDVVTIQGMPAARRVRLFDQRTAKLVGETWSSASGVYRFEYLDQTLTYFVVADDWQWAFDLVAHGNIVPETMP